MALQTSGQISLSDVRTELEGTGQISLGDTAVRELFGISSGEIQMSDGYGASAGPSLNVLTLSTATQITAETITLSEPATRDGLGFGADGTKMYVVDDGSNAVHQYTLSTAWDISTATYDNVELNTSPGFIETNPKGIAFRPDGSRVFVVGEEAGITTWELSTPWDLSSASNIENADRFGRGIDDISFNFDGTRMYFNEFIGERAVRQYNVTNFYYPIPAFNQSPAFVKNDFVYENRTSKLIGDNILMVHNGKGIVNRYDFSTPNELSSAVLSADSFSDPSLTLFTGLFAFSDSGHKMYIGQGSTIYTYS